MSNFGNLTTYQLSILNVQFWELTILATFNFCNLQFWLLSFQFWQFQFRLLSSKIFEWAPWRRTKSATTTLNQLYGSCVWEFIWLLACVYISFDKLESIFFMMFSCFIQNLEGYFYDSSCFIHNLEFFVTYFKRKYSYLINDYDEFFKIFHVLFKILVSGSFHFFGKIDQKQKKSAVSILPEYDR